MKKILLIALAFTLNFTATAQMIETGIVENESSEKVVRRIKLAIKVPEKINPYFLNNFCQRILYC